MLNFAAEEADRLLHHSIEPHHLLLALMRDPNSFAATSLTRYGLTLEGLREFIVTQPATGPSSEHADRQSENAAARALASIHIQRIMKLVRDLEEALAIRERKGDPELVASTCAVIAHVLERFSTE